MHKMLLSINPYSSRQLALDALIRQLQDAPKQRRNELLREIRNLALQIKRDNTSNHFQ
ncbi:MAG: hypothetical protein RIC03_06835 [Cyclobacteriaceae bacterium]